MFLGLINKVVVSGTLEDISPYLRGLSRYNLFLSKSDVAKLVCQWAQSNKSASTAHTPQQTGY